MWVFCIGFVLFLLSSHATQRSAWSPLEGVIVEITAPAQQFLTHSYQAVENVWLRYFHLTGVRRENEELKRTLDAMRMENNRYRELVATHARLRRLLGFKQTLERPVLPVQVIGLDPSGWFKSVVVDKGRREGIEPAMPVVNAAGVVGRTVSVTTDFAKVLLLIDQNSAVDCLVQRSRDRGMLRGLSREICKLDYVTKASSVQPGDRVVTSGLGGIFTKGLLVGTVLSVQDRPGELFKEIEIQPAVDFSTLEEVLVIIKGETRSVRSSEEP